jgi:hypothetical protein
MSDFFGQLTAFLNHPAFKYFPVIYERFQTVNFCHGFIGYGFYFIPFSMMAISSAVKL